MSGLSLQVRPSPETISSSLKGLFQGPIREMGRSSASAAAARPAAKQYVAPGSILSRASKAAVTQPTWPLEETLQSTSSSHNDSLMRRESIPCRLGLASSGALSTPPLAASVAESVAPPQASQAPAALAALCSEAEKGQQHCDVVAGGRGRTGPRWSSRGQDILAGIEPHTISALQGAVNAVAGGSTVDGPAVYCVGHSGMIKVFRIGDRLQVGVY